MQKYLVRRSGDSLKLYKQGGKRSLRSERFPDMELVDDSVWIDLFLDGLVEKENIPVDVGTEFESSILDTNLEKEKNTKMSLDLDEIAGLG